MKTKILLYKIFRILNFIVKVYFMVDKFLDSLINKF